MCKCAQCASCATPKGLAPISIFFCKIKEHRDTRGSLSEMKNAYIGKLANGIVEANTLVAVNFMFKANATIEEQRNTEKIGCAARLFPQAPVIDSETGYRISCESEIFVLRALKVQST